MPRYIDADKVMEEIERIGGHNLCEWETIGVKALIDRQPTADVAPRSEVERLVDKWIGAEGLTNDEKSLRLIEALKDEAHRYERYYFNHEYDKMIAEAKAEVAREIFEEIDKRFEALLKFYPCNGEFEDAKRFVDFHWKHIRHSIMCDYDAELKKENTEGDDPK